jgi:Ni/Co efflux regulator RcnB
MTLHKISKITGQMLLAAAILSATPAMADKPLGAGGGGKHSGKQHKHQQNERHQDQDERHEEDRHSSGGEGHFIDRHRAVIRDYYAGEYQSTGRCPPGLAKKHNGCMPPGQAKKWAIGRPLPRDVVFYDLPPAVLGNFGPPPPGYRFVRVASDILMITIGSGMVVDAINDLGR